MAHSPIITFAGVLEDTMGGFFLSETTKCLFLLGAIATGLFDVL